MSASKSFLAGLVTAAALAGAAWVLRVQPALDAAERRALDAEETARSARRETSDAQLWAESERERNRTNEDRVKELERALATSRPPPSTSTTPGEDSGHDTTKPPDLAPELWDRTRLTQEIENLARAAQIGQKHQRFPLVLAALRAHPEESSVLLAQMLNSNLDATFMANAASLADALGDKTTVPALLARWRKESEPVARRAILRALANLPGTDAVPILAGVWADTTEERQLRLLAIHGLALRGNEIARSVVASAGAASPPQRVRAVESLRAYAEQSGWSDTTLVPIFVTALRTADGPAQRKLALIALEGLWSKDSVAALTEFADDTASPPELAVRARKAAQAIAAGEPRPAGAGTPERGLTPAAGDE